MPQKIKYFSCKKNLRKEKNNASPANYPRIEKALSTFPSNSEREENHDGLKWVTQILIVKKKARQNTYVKSQTTLSSIKSSVLLTWLWWS